ncbi:MAG: hypothetical protein KDA47_06020 [Planctomycetales bacterium]|nr:hypothetical protein [Planctomycetales bacterium]
MNYRQYQSLVAERNAVAEMLERIPPEQVISRKGASGRLAAIQAELDAVESAPRRPLSGRLTFDGRPVIRSHGMFADFGAKAMAAFSDTVAVLTAAKSGALADSGPIPNREQNQVLITGTALGSFGFEIEEQPTQLADFGDKTPVAVALEETIRLLESVAASDDELTDAVAGLDRRVVRTLKNFLEVLASGEAICSLEVEGRQFGFTSVGQVRNAVNRLADDNIHEVEQAFFGEFIGCMPASRQFEFHVASDKQVIKGRIRSDVSQPELINLHLNQPIQLPLTAIRAGNGRVKYVLRALPDWPDSEGKPS